RDFHVTGVQTCALPISAPPSGRSAAKSGSGQINGAVSHSLQRGFALALAQFGMRRLFHRTGDQWPIGLNHMTRVDVLGTWAVSQIGRASCRGREEGRGG